MKLVLGRRINQKINIDSGNILAPNRGPFYWQILAKPALREFMAWISNDIHVKQWDVIKIVKLVA